MDQKLEHALKITRRAALFGGAGLGLAACASPPRGPAVKMGSSASRSLLHAQDGAAVSPEREGARLGAPGNPLAR